VDRRGTDKTLEFDIYPNAGKHEAEWRLNGAMSGSALNCASANVDTIRVKSKRVLLEDYSVDPAPMEVVDTFPCDNLTDENLDCPSCVGGGESRHLPYGYYAVSLEALSSGVVVGTLDYPMGDPQSYDTTKIERTSVWLWYGDGGAGAFSYVGSPDSYTIVIENR